MHQLQVEFIAGRLQQLQLLEGLIQQLRLHQATAAGLLHSQSLLLRGAPPLGPLKQDHLLAAAVDHTAETVAAADGPIHRPAGQAQVLLDFIQQIQGLPPRAIHLVDEGEDRNAPHAAHLEQLAGLRLEALRGVLEHHRVIGGRQGAVGVLRKVLVAGGVQQVDRAAAVVELQHRGGDRDAPLLLQLHPVGGDLALLPLGLHRPSLLDRTAVEQQLFGEGGLAGVGVGNDREVAAPRHRLSERLQLGGGGAAGHRLSLPGGPTPPRSDPRGAPPGGPLPGPPPAPAGPPPQG